MLAHATRVETGMELFEIVGTGGDNAHSFNISTTSALVAAAGGMKVANTATGPPPLNAERRTVWKLWGSTSWAPDQPRHPFLAASGRV